jgi:hypothetical protein
MKIKGSQVIRIKFGNGAVTKAYIIFAAADSMTVRIATGFSYEVQRQANQNGEYAVIA